MNIPVKDQVDVAWWVGDRCHRLWRDAKDSPYDYVRRMATASRVVGIVSHDRVLNIKQTMQRRAHKDRELEQ